MTLRAASALLGVMAILQPDPAKAQDSASLAIYQRLEATYKAPTGGRLSAALEPPVDRFASSWHGCRPKITAVKSVRPATADQIVIGQIAKRGAHNGWVVVATQRGCPDHAPIQFLVTDEADGTLSAGMIGLGESLAWPSLARDVQMPIMVAVDTVLPQAPVCPDKAPRRLDTKVLSRSKDLGAPVYGVIFAGEWTELWTFGKCGVRATIPVTFTADGTGGANYRLGIKDAKLLP